MITLGAHIAITNITLISILVSPSSCRCDALLSLVRSSKLAVVQFQQPVANHHWHPPVYQKCNREVMTSLTALPLIAISMARPIMGCDVKALVSVSDSKRQQIPVTHLVSAQTIGGDAMIRIVTKPGTISNNDSISYTKPSKWILSGCTREEKGASGSSLESDPRKYGLVTKWLDFAQRLYWYGPTVMEERIECQNLH